MSPYKLQRIFTILTVITVMLGILPLGADAQGQLTQQQLDDYADQALQAVIEHYWQPQTFSLKEWDHESQQMMGFWGVAQMWDAVIDGVERTGGVDSPWFPLMEQIVAGQAIRTPSFLNPFYDDMAWWALASLRAYDITGDAAHLKRSERLWDAILGGWSNDLGGGIWWNADRQTEKNACINGPAAIIGARLYQVTGDEAHLDWAIKIYDWLKRTLVSSGGIVYDHINTNGSRANWQFTYNQGTYLGAAVELYRITGEQQYLEDARKAANYAMLTMVDRNGALRNEGTDDAGGFKGIFIRYLYELAITDPEGDKYMAFIHKNAESVALNAINDKGLIGPSWSEPETGPIQSLTHASGVMLLNIAAASKTSSM